MITAAKTEWAPIDGELLSIDLNTDGIAAAVFELKRRRVIATEYGTMFDVEKAFAVRWVDHGHLAILADKDLLIYQLDGTCNVTIEVVQPYDCFLAGPEMVVFTSYVYQSKQFDDGLTAYLLDGTPIYHHNRYGEGTTIWSLYAASWTSDGRVACLNNFGAYQVIDPVAVEVDIHQVPERLKTAYAIQAFDAMAPEFHVGKGDEGTLLRWHVETEEVVELGQATGWLSPLRGGGFVKPVRGGYERLLISGRKTP